MVLVVDIVIGFLNDGRVPALLVLVAAGAIGGFLFRKLRMRFCFGQCSASGSKRVPAALSQLGLLQEIGAPSD
jgi:hypothetical protein